MDVGDGDDRYRGTIRGGRAERGAAVVPPAGGLDRGTLGLTGAPAGRPLDRDGGAQRRRRALERDERPGGRSCRRRWSLLAGRRDRLTRVVRLGRRTLRRLGGPAA